jgi:riboflavin synthase
MKIGERLGGHLVQGHVDSVTQILDRRHEGGSIVLGIRLPPSLAPYFVEKGSACLDGVSLTVYEVGADRFRVMIIPETQERTTLAHKRPGDSLNLEVDAIGKYVARLYGLERRGALNPDVMAVVGSAAP